jgi:hypothetical protein
MTRFFAAASLAGYLMLGGSGVAGERPVRELVTDWNAQVLAMAEAEDGLLTLKGVRTAAMMHIAIHDALTAIQPRYAPYAYHGTAPQADPVAAGVTAAYTVAAQEYPDQVPALAALRDAWTPRSGAGAGIEVGTAAARTILDARADDGWNSEAEYQWHPMAPGVYAEFAEHSNTPLGFVFGAGWASARPFALQRADQFRAPPPPEIESDDNTAAYQEVKRLGREESTDRTADQTHLAFWWKDFAERSHNRLARDLV